MTGAKEMTVDYNNDLEITGVQHTIPQPFDESYTYDTRGNRLTSLTNTYTYNDLNQLTSTATHTYTYNQVKIMSDVKSQIANVKC